MQLLLQQETGSGTAQSRKLTGRSRSFPPRSCLPVFLESPLLAAFTWSQLDKQKRGVQSPRCGIAKQNIKGWCGLRVDNLKARLLKVWLILKCLGNFLNTLDF